MTSIDLIKTQLRSEQKYTIDTDFHNYPTQCYVPYKQEKK